MSKPNKKLEEALRSRGLAMRHTRQAKSKEEVDQIREENRVVRRKINRIAGHRISQPNLLALAEDDF
jgi:hypothetical protein